MFTSKAHALETRGNSSSFFENKSFSHPVGGDSMLTSYIPYNFNKNLLEAEFIIANAC